MIHGLSSELARPWPTCLLSKQNLKPTLSGETQKTQDPPGFELGQHPISSKPESAAMLKKHNPGEKHKVSVFNLSVVNPNRKGTTMVSHLLVRIPNFFGQSPQSEKTTRTLPKSTTPGLSYGSKPESSMSPLASACTVLLRNKVSLVACATQISNQGPINASTLHE